MRNQNNISVVITSINKPNKVIKKFFSECKKKKIKFIIVGDKKTPKYDQKYGMFNIKEQNNLKFKLSKSLPLNSYSRKNIGYLIGMKKESEIIIETDDDNYPKNNFFMDLDKLKKIKVLSGTDWVNIFRLFSSNKIGSIWPRGFPLDEIKNKSKIKYKYRNVISPVQQRLCDGNPDVDAIFRLTKKFKFIKFKKNIKLALDRNSLCPFNSQNTVWHKEAFPLMYLPSYCTMRATDIWRSFVALRILKCFNWKLTFLPSTVIQNRNFHNLLDDFNLEIPVYKNTKVFNEVLSSLSLSDDKSKILLNIFKCYDALIKHRILDKKELSLVYKWLSDIQKIYPNLQKI